MNNKLIKLAHEISSTPLMVHVSSDIGKLKYIFSAGIPAHYLLLLKNEPGTGTGTGINIKTIKDRRYIWWMYSQPI